jgi:DNA segregation ATPase FtsK/SpoIIIE, S-DNA-T family
VPGIISSRPTPGSNGTLGTGSGRAARLIDFMAADGIVGEYKSGSAREVLYSWEEWEALKNGGTDQGEAA